MSIHPDLIELIHADIDGVAGEVEQLRLREAIARDPEVREEYDRQRGLSDILSRLVPERPGDDLVSNVQRHLRARRASTVAGVFRRLKDAWPGGRMAIRYAYAVAAGAVIGTIAVQVATGGSLFLGSGVSEREASGTLLPPPGAPRVSLAAAGVSGFVTLGPSSKAGPGTHFGLEAASDRPVDLLVRFTPSYGGGKIDVSLLKDGAEVPAGSLGTAPKR